MKDSIQLLRKLNEASARALNEAASFCLSRGHQEILPEHFLIKLLERDNNDLNLILRQNEININRLWDDILAGLDTLNWQHGQQKPELSRALMKWLEQAWMIASVDNEQQTIRSLNLLQAIQKVPSIFTLFDLWQLLMFRSGQLTEASHWLNQYSIEAPEQAIPATAQPAPSEDETAVINNSLAASAVQTHAQQEALARFTLNLTARAKEGHIDAIFGRDDEIAQIEDILSRRRKNNPILVGEPGVGKTALVEGLALKIANNQVGSHLQGVQILALDMGLLQAGAGMKGEFEQRLKTVIEAIQHHPQPTILFIDEAHTLIGAGNEAGGSDAANLLKPALARGQLRTIAATTWREYKQYFETDAALTRRFQPVKVDEPDNKHAIQMLRGLADLYARHHQVHILDEAIEAAVLLSRRYLPERQLPDKAIDLIDTACAKVRLGLQTAPLALIKQQAQLQAYQQEISRLEQDAALGHTIDQQRLDYCRQQAEQLAQQSEQTRQQFTTEQLAAQEVLTARQQQAEQLHHYNQTFQQQQQYINLDVDANVIATIISEWTGIAVGQLLDDEINRFIHMADELNQQIIGQADSIEIIVNHIRTQKMGLGNSQQPLGVFLLTGPSGTGKTKTAQALAAALFNSQQAMITINMSEYQEAHSVAQLKGAPPGYVGYGQGGILTEAVRKQPYAVILLDEIEKAHPDVLNVFYQVFDQGFMRDGEGRLIDFKNTIILMTANIGSEQLHQAPEADLTTRLQLIDEPLRQALPAALLGRMQILAYRSLASTDMEHIIRQQFAQLFSKIQRQFGAASACSDQLITALAQSVAGHDLGVRHFEHTLQQQIIPELSRQLLITQQQHQRIAHIQLDIGETGLLITLSETAPAQQLPDQDITNSTVLHQSLRPECSTAATDLTVAEAAEVES